MPLRSKLATEKIGDAAVAAKTRRTWREWFKILDAAGARKMDHRRIVAVARRNGADSWWAQMVTVGYEQDRGLRKKHERPDGFEISSSRTIGAPVATVYAAWIDSGTRGRWLRASPFTVRKATDRKSLRLTWNEPDTRVEVQFSAKGAGRSQLTVQHGRLPSAAAAERMKAWWKMRLNDLKNLLEQGA